MTNSVYKLDAHLVVLVFYEENRFHMLIQFVIYKITDYLLGIDIETNDGKLFILNVYLPYQSSDNFGEFCNYPVLG